VAETDSAGTEKVIPVLEERATIGTRPVETDRLVLRTRVETRDEVVERLLRSDEVVVERVPIGRVVETAPEVREQDGVLIVPVIEEELVLQTRLVLKEEVRIRRTEGTRPVRRDVQLRREVVSTEHLPPDRSPTKEDVSNGNDE
jgi:stress response protein YsnF